MVGVRGRQIANTVEMEAEQRKEGGVERDNNHVCLERLRPILANSDLFSSHYCKM